jgi:hypothetical protein
MTLVEFLAPLGRSTHRGKCLAVLYFKDRYEAIASMTAEQINSALIFARVPKSKSINAADVLSKSGELVDSSGVSGKSKLWRLTTTGAKYVRKLLDLPDDQPELEHSVISLETLVATFKNPDTREYILEAVRCLRFDALRPAIVFLWAGAVSVLRERCVAKGLTQVNEAVRHFDAKAHEIRKADDFAYIKESVLLLTAERVGTLDKNQRTTLEDALNLRNKCGHPTKYSPGLLKASSFVEDVIGIVFRGA